jgi:uncharacterized linocin/CFP29 family protein
MANNSNRTGFWTDSVWSSIDAGVTQAVGAIRVAQKIWPTVSLPDVTSVPADEFNPEKMSITEGLTKPYVELAVEFSLTNGQVNSDPAGVTAITLAKLAAKALALAEDMVILQGRNVKLPPTIRIESGGDSLGDGIIGVAKRSITVEAPDPAAPTNSGGNILAAIAQGIAQLTAEQQAPPYALIEDTNAFAATWGSVINSAPAYTVLNPVLTGGISGTGAMPANTGLLIALGGDPTTIYLGVDATTEPTHKAGAGQYFFRAFERAQYVARDPRAFVKLDFSYLASAKSQGKTVTARQS